MFKTLEVSMRGYLVKQGKLKQKMSLKGKKIFIQKSYGNQLYKWSPLPNNFSNKKDAGKTSKPFFCNATAGSQGEDWITTYVYDLVVVNSQQKHLAYVECDYVE